jgi:hypothetical protein
VFKLRTENAFMMRIFLSLFIIIPFMAFGQALLFEENFNYPENTNLTNYGWVAHSGTGSPIQVVTPGLTFAGYPPSGIGNAVVVAGGSGSREDVNRQFSEQASGSLYSAFMMNLSDATELGSYFYHLGPTTLGTTFRGKIFANRDASNNVAFGLAKADNAAVLYTPFSFSMNTTYLIVMKYQFNSGSINDDVVSLWIDPDLSGSEPTPDLSQTDTFDDAVNLGTVALRQGSDGPVLTLDGIRIGISWESLSSTVGNLPPVISNIIQTPLLPESTDTVTVSADVTDDGAVANVRLFYSISSAPFDSTDMALTSGDTYEAAISPQADGTTVEYYIKATDNEGLTSTSLTSSYTVGGAQITPIADIQANPSAYTIVTIEGIVTLGSGITIDTRTDAYVQDSSGRGINVFSFDPPDPLLVRGNRVQITGTITEFSGVTEITDYSIQLVSSGNPVPNPLELTTQQANNIDLEGTYLKTSGTVTARDDFSDATNITLDDGSGEVLIRVWTTTGIDLSGISVNDNITVLAVMDLFNNVSQLTPGYQDEIMEAGGNPGDGSGTATIQPDSVGISEIVSEAITIQGESPYTIASVSVQIPDSWLWSGSGIDVQLSGSGLTGALVDVQGKLITVSNAMVTDLNNGAITINQLTSPGSSEQSVFAVKTAIDGGTLTAVSSSPRVTVGAGGPPITPIADIQANPTAYSTVNIEGIVTLGAGITITSRTDAYVQDNSGRGINIFSFDPPDPLLERGNRVRITGTVTEFGGVTEITDYTIQLISTENDPPQPLPLSTNDANNIALEGTYINIKGVATSIEPFSDATNITVDDGSGEVLIRVWGTTGINLGFLSVGDSADVTAVMDVFSNAAQLVPGYQDEIVEPGTGSAADGSGAASLSITSAALGDTISEVIVAMIGTTTDTIRTIEIDVPIFWNWNMDSLEITGSGFQGASAPQISSEEGIAKIVVENANITLTDSGIVTFNNMRAATDSINSIFWIQTAGENGRLRYIASSPIATVGGGNRYWMYDLQTNSANFPGNVTVRGVTTIGAGLLRITSSGGTPLTTAYIQDESGRGLNLFRFGVLDTAILERNNLVEATGTVTEFELTTELEYTSLSYLATITPGITPIRLTNREANSAKWDGTLIETDGVVIDQYSAGGGTTIVLSDGDGITNARIWDTANLDLSRIEVNDAVIVSGVGGVFISSGNDTTYQILPVYQDQIAINPSYHPSLADVFLKVDPHPFVPDRGEKIGITYNVGAVNNQAAIRIFDLGGRLVYTLLSEPATIIQRHVEWDGRNELRDLVPLGTYICHLEVVEKGSGEKKTAMAPIVVGTILKR